MLFLKAQREYLTSVIQLMHLYVKPQEDGGGGGWATYGVLTVRSVSRVGILIAQDIPRVGNLT